MNENIIDDQGTTQDEALEIINKLWEKGFDSDTGNLALALGRPETETADLLAGREMIDEDLLMKIRRISQVRHISVG